MTLVLDDWGVCPNQHAVVEAFVTGAADAPWAVRVRRRGCRVLLEMDDVVRRERVADNRWSVRTQTGLFGRTYPSLESAKAAQAYFVGCLAGA